MRFTSVLGQVNYHRHFQRIWKRQRKFEFIPYSLSPELQEMGINIKDAKEILLETKLFKPVLKASNKLPYPLPPSVFTQEMPYYRMHDDIKITENENQTLALTKTIPYQGLPNNISSLIDTEKLPNEDELVQTNILQAQIWDAMQDKLPKIVDPERPGYIFKRAYGIEYSKKVTSLLEKLLFLCDSATGRYAECFQRDKILNAYAEMSITRGGSNVVFQMPCDVLLKANKPLEQFASASEVNATKNELVPNIYPIKPVLDLDKCKENPLINNKIHHKFPSIERVHTLFVAQKSPDPWLPSQLLGKAIATSFTFAAVEARNKYGADIKELPEPISIQCMFMDAKYTNFIAYQLNTLDLDHDDGIKNQVWIDEGADLYESISELDLVTNYNPNIFPKMLAFHINGLCTTNS